GSSAIVVVDAARVRFLTDFRYVTSIADTRGTPRECPDLDLVTVEGSYDAALAQMLSGAALTRVGFEAAHLTVARHGWLTSVVGHQSAVSSQPPIGNQSSIINHQSSIDLVPTEQIVERARVRKDDYEIATVRE